MLLWIMLGITLAVAIGVMFLAIYLYRYDLRSRYDREDAINGIVGSFCITILLGVIVTAITIPIVIDANKNSIVARDVEDNSYTIRALANNSGIEGSFFLGSGYIEGKQVFNYITEDGNGAIRLQSMDASQATIFEDTNNAHLRIIKTVRSLPSVVPWDLGSTMHYDFHIPKGSVIQNYKVDVAK